ncbi:sugar ABC transporter permease [Pseudoroseomonas rhizosphaerae]|uniref:Sugar ABC transporter permease n=1 Tax=Teichococcus rhizosphaerae TaxID=1335062 RepID=A0A2C7A143_9PROT|nr:ABC transporter permease [Pseudoroseomonas rhizosphaerae]PHK93768.1 sugar ABC transporter permease [Pseudoroseomonas rhizosphaerae]
MIADVPRRAPGSALEAQVRVISALFMRELLTRFGTSRLGYVWLIGEPMMLAVMISTVHWLSGSHLPNDLPTFLFYGMGYVPFMMFRSITSRGASAVTSNMSLLFHRSISLLDLMIARNLMEMMVCAAIVLLFILGGMLTVGEVPSDPALLILGLLLSALLGHGLAMVLGSVQVFLEFTERLVHPFTYILMPISATFYMVEYMPPEAREMLLWNPLVHVHEMNRWAMFGDRVVPHFDLGYVMIWVIGLNLVGMAGLRGARPRLSMSD